MASSRFDGRTLGETRLRTLTGVSIVAVVNDDVVVPSPTPDEILLGGSSLVVIGTEPGIAGGNRTVLAATRSGRAALRRWLATPVTHLRDVRSELLLKLVIAEICEIDITPMLDEQRTVIAATADAIRTKHAVGSDDSPSDDDAESVDVVALWRTESADAALRFLDRLRPN